MKRCPRHPEANDGPFGGACVWCSGKFPSINTPHLPIEEQRKLALQTGKEIKDKDDLRRYHEVAGTRCVEAGEQADIQQKDMKEWVDSGGTKRYGKNLPESCRPAPVKNPIDIRQIYEEIRGSERQRSDDNDD